MLSRDYDMRNPADVRELFCVAPPFLVAILAAVHQHNSYANKLGFLYSEKSFKHDRDQKEPLTNKRNKLRRTLHTALASVGYRYFEVQGRRISSLLTRGGQKAKVGSIVNINQDALFIFSHKNYDESTLNRLVVAKIIEE
jgi:hypothetical protein